MKRIYTILLSVGTLVIALDQWTKAWALDALRFEGASIPLLSWFNFTLVYNYGAAFGMFRGFEGNVRTVFFLLMPVTVLGILWWTFVRQFKERDLLGAITMGFVFGGAIGNVIDRIRFGYVIDFVDWFYPSAGGCLPGFYKTAAGSACHWPVFNIADSAILVAMVLLMLQSFKKTKA